MKHRLPAAILPLLLLAAAVVPAQEHRHDPAMHMQHAPAAMPPPQAAPLADTRAAVRFPTQMKEHTLANMRDHLLALQQMQAALAKEDYGQLAEIAERRLGMSSLELHGAHDVAKYMPQGMQDAGTAMHRSASRLAIAAGDAAASGQIKPVVGALAELPAPCVACHAGYRLE